jgi:hypothetical protein
MDHGTEVAIVNRAERKSVYAPPALGYKQQVYEWGGLDVAEGEAL